MIRRHAQVSFFSLRCAIAFVLFWSWIPLVWNTAQASIEELKSFKDFSLNDHKIDSNTLVIFDVDDVLLKPDDLILRSSPTAIKYFQHLFEHFSQQYFNQRGKPLTSKEYEFLMSEIYSTSKRHIIELKVVELIQNLQKQNIKVILLTACQVGPYGSIKSMADWRIQDLKNLGLNFEQAFPKIKDLSFDNFSDEKSSQPLYKSGCLFSTNKYIKGSVLEVFIKRYLKETYPEWTPNKIIFFDDQKPNLKSVQECAQRLNISYSGFHYTNSEDQVLSLDLKKAEKQIRYLFENKKWLPDHDPALDTLYIDRVLGFD